MRTTNQKQIELSETGQTSTTIETFLARTFGTQVAQEYPLIERILTQIAEMHKSSLVESDLSIFCRQRQAKLAVHGQQEAEEDFEPVRLLNMLFEGCLKFLNEAATLQVSGQYADAKDKITCADGIILHLAETLDFKNRNPIAPELLRLYDFSHEHLKEALEQNSKEKTLAVHGVIEKIYLGYLEVELRSDADNFFKKKITADSKQSNDVQ